MIPLSAAGCEADDICAAVAVSFPDKQVVIVSGDSDMKQLLKLPNVRVYDIGKKPHAFLKDLDPDEPCDQDPARWKAIIGDSTDEIPGITGPKTARKLLLDEAAFEQALDTKVCRTQLDAGKKWREVYDRNRKLVTLVGDDRLFPLPEPQLVRDAVLGYPVSFEEEVYATAALEMNFESWYTASGPTDQWAKQVETWKQVAFQRRKPVSPVNR
jgi:hypothetical protein